MKAIRTKYDDELIEIDGINVDSIKFENLVSSYIKPGISVTGRMVVNGVRSYQTQYANTTIEDLPEDLYLELVSWAAVLLEKRAAEDVARHEAKENGVVA